MKIKPSKSNRTFERGNVFFTLFGAVAVVGVLGAGIMATMRGPLSTMVNVNRRTQAEADMNIASKMVLLEAVNQSDNGDCDEDGFVEPLPYKSGSPAPTNGGQLPDTVGSNKNDPWGTPYGYCAWDPGPDADLDDCNGDNRLKGTEDTDASYTIIAIVSAGPNQAFETTCTGGANPAITKQPNSDDLQSTYSYDTANAATGGLWKIKVGDTGTATIDKDIEALGADFSGDVSIGPAPLGPTPTFDLEQALVKFPTSDTPGLGDADCTAGNNLLLRINLGTTPPNLEVCDGANTAWVSVAAGAAGVGLWKNDGPGGATKAYYSAGNVGIGNNNPSYDLDVTGDVHLTENILLDAAKSVVFGDPNTGPKITESSGALELTSGSTELAISSSGIDASGNTTITGSGADPTTKALEIFNSTPSSLLVVENSGHTGIGVADPDDKLDVGGSIDVSDHYKLDGVNFLTDNGIGTSILLGANVSTGMTGDNNTVIGDNAGAITTGTHNVILGASAGRNLETGKNNILIGSHDVTLIDAPTAATNDFLNIGNTIFGDLANDRIGIGTSSMDDTLEVAGTIDATGNINSGSNVIAGADVIATGNVSAGGTVFADILHIDGLSQDFSDVADCDNADEKIVFEGGVGWKCATDSGGGAGGAGETLYETLIIGNDADGEDIDDVGTMSADEYCDENGDNCFTPDGIIASAQPAAPDRSIQFNNGSAFGGDANFVYTAAGRVGIGLANPAYKLDVDGDIRTGGNLRVNYGWIIEGDNMHYAGTPTGMATGGDGRMLYLKGGNPGDVYGPTLSSVMVNTSAAVTNGVGVFSILENNTEHFRVAGGGQVGIGDTTPDTGVGLYGQALKLDVEGAIGGSHFCDKDGENCFTAASIAGSGLWERNGTVVRTKTPVDYATDDFVFGAAQLADIVGADDNSRFFFDKSKGAFRAGIAPSTQWDDANIGDYGSVALGYETIASGISSTAIGNVAMAIGEYSTALGRETIATGNNSTALGQYVAVGNADGTTGDMHGDYSMGIGLTSASTGTRPQITGKGDLGIFMQDQTGVILSADNIMALLGGRFVIDPNSQATETNVSTGVQQLELDVEGDIGAMNYCDQAGNNCFTPSQVYNGTARLSGLLAANQANSINNGDHAQTWNWQVTTNDKDAFTFGENTASTATGTSSILKATTLGSSTATPLMVTNLGDGNSFRVNDETGDADATPFVINASGNVGIGTATPGYKLDVTGTTNLNGTVTFPGSGSWSGSSGNLGIGTAAGNEKLVISGGVNSLTAAGGSVRIDGTGGKFGGIHFTGQTTSDMYFGRASSGDDLIISTANQTALERVRFTQSGAVGIGDTTPDTGDEALLLDVEGPIGGTHYCDEDGNNCFTPGGILANAQPAAPDRSIQFNNASAFGGDATFLYTSAGDFIVGSTQTADTGNAAHDSRLFFDKSKGAFRAGTAIGTQWDDANVGASSIATGESTTANGPVSTAFGNGTTASGFYSTAMGSSSVAYGSTSTATGFGTTASGDFSISMNQGTQAFGDLTVAMGYSSWARGDLSLAAGLSTDAGSYAETSFGVYSLDTSGDLDSWVATDTLFEIGNGADASNRANALTMLKNGKTQISNSLQIGGGGSYNTLDVNGGVVIGFVNNGSTAPTNGLLSQGTIQAGLGGAPANVYATGNFLTNGELQFNDSAVKVSRSTNNLYLYGFSGLDFGTNGVPNAMSITSAGDVGIGDTSPDSGDGGQLALDVEGNIGAVDYCDENGDDCFSALEVVTGLAGALPAAPDRSIQFNNASAFGGDANFVYTATGRLGLGTTSPSYKLDLGTGAVQARIGAAISGDWLAGTGLAFFGNQALDHSAQGNYALLQGSDGTTYLNASNGTAINFRINNSSLAYLTSTGFGVGGNATTKLSVTGTGDLFDVTNNTDQNFRINISAVGAVDKRALLAPTTGTNLALGVGSTEYMRITNAGTVGIGDTTPDTGEEELELDVEGDIGAMNYCDENGDDCFSALEVVTGLAGALPAAPDRSIQFNNASAFGGSANLVYTAGGNFGIGTSSPTTEFMVVGTAGAGSILSTAGAGTRMFFYPRAGGAFRAGTTTSTQWDVANVGWYSIAGGYATTASETASTAFGQYSVASGGSSVAMGNSNTASGSASVALGEGSTASGAYSMSGIYASNASGIASLALGTSLTASGNYSVAFGQGNTASGNYSTAIGQGSSASNTNSIAIGHSAVSDGVDSIAIGSNSTYANAAGSIALGNGTHAQGTNSTTMGIGTHAGSYAETSLGQYSLNTAGTAGSWVATDTLFEIGNGVDGNNRANALTLLKNGQLGLGDDSPDSGDGGQLMLDVEGNIGAIDYCDENGDDCFSALEVVTGLAGALPAAPDRSIQFNNASAFGGSANLIYTTAGRVVLTTTDNNVFISGGNDTTTATNSVGIGAGSLQANTSGGGNTATGRNALFSNTAGEGNTAYGIHASYFNETGNYNVAIGANALENHTTGSSNTALGTSAGIGGTYGGTVTSNNVFVGFNSAAGVTTGGNNIILGYQAADNISTGANNIVIGYDIDLPTAATNEYLSIGNILFGDIGTTSTDPRIGAHKYCDENLDNCFVASEVTETLPAAPDRSIQFNNASNFGGDANFVYTATGRLGLGTSNPLATFDLNGNAILHNEVNFNALNSGYSFGLSGLHTRFVVANDSGTQRGVEFGYTNNDTWGGTFSQRIFLNGYSGGGTFQGTVTGQRFRTVEPVVGDDYTPIAAISTGFHGYKGFIVQGVASQSANLFEAQDSAGAALVAITGNGLVGIGDDTPDSGDGGQLALDVEGNIGAIDYCDENGDDCFSALEVVTGLAGALPAAPDRSIQFNNASAFGGDATFLYTADGDFIVGSTQLDDTNNAAHDDRLFYDKSKAAFRAGSADGSQWNDGSVGDFSAAFGQGNIASGTHSFAAGMTNTAGGNYSTALGNATAANSQSSTALGTNTVANGNASTAMGFGSTTGGSADGAFAFGGDVDNGLAGGAADGVASMAGGINNVASGYASTAFGINNTASGTNSTVIGQNMIVSGNNSVGITASFADMTPGTLSGDNSMAIFLSAQEGVDVSDQHILAVLGGRMIVDPKSDGTAQTNVSTGDEELELDVEGNIGAVDYCDENGDNCFSALEVVTGLAGALPAAPNTSIQFNNNSAFGGSANLTWADGANLLVQGTHNSSAALTAAGAGTKMFFYPRKSAFRAGAVNSSQWDDANIGAYSAAFGGHTTASGDYSFAAGYSTTAVGTASFAVGTGSIATANYSLAAGASFADGDYSAAFGNATTAEGIASVAMGEGGTASGDNSVVMGKTTAASGNNSLASGLSTTASGNNSFAGLSSSIASGGNSMALGTFANASGVGASAFGRRVTVGSGTAGDGAGDRSFGFGLQSATTITTPPVITGDRSMVLFFDGGANNTNSGYDFTASDKFALIGGEFQIDDQSSTANKGCFRYDSANTKLQFSHDCSTYYDLVDAASVPATEPAAPDRSIQFNNASAFGGDANFVYTNTGRLGLGTSSPAASLDVSKSTNGEQGIYVSNTNAGASAYAGFRALNGGASTDALQFGALGTGWTTTGGYRQDGAFVGADSGLSGGLSIIAGNASGETRFYTGGFADANQRMTITSGGNVGIGTATPSRQLTINQATGSGTNPGLKISQDNVAGLDVYEVNTNGSVYLDNIYDNASVGTFFRNRTGGTPLNTLAILSTGNIGVGITDPSVKLQIQGSVAATTPGTEEEIKLFRPINAGNSFSQGASFALGTYGTPSNVGFAPLSRLDIKLKTTADDSDTIDATVMTLQANGQIGIGDATPDTGDEALLLDVEGAIGGTAYCDENGDNCFAATDVGTAVAAGPDRSIQFNNASAFDGSDTFLYTADGDFIVGSTQLADDGNTAHDARMFFDKSKAAFRVGRAQSTQWDDANIGSGSMAFGLNSTVTGINGIAFGTSHTVSAGNAAAIGFTNTASGLTAMAIGHQNTVSGNYAVALGQSNSVSGTNAFAAGGYNTATSLYSMAFGRLSDATGQYAIAAGYDATAAGDSSFAVGLQANAAGSDSFAIGRSASADEAGAIAIGWGTNVTGQLSMALGALSTVISDSSMALGYNTSAGDPTNTGDNYSMAIGLTSNAALTSVTGYGSLGIFLSGTANNTEISEDGVMAVMGGKVAIRDTSPDTGDEELVLDVEGAIGGTAYCDENGDNCFAATDVGTATAAGPDRSIQFNNASAFDGDALFLYTSAGDFLVGSTQLADDGDSDHANRMFFDKSKGAFRAGFTNGPEWDDANVGVNSIAVGFAPTASGNQSVAFGDLTVASSGGSFAAGIQSTASGPASVAIGNSVIASGDYSVAMGNSSTAAGDNSIAMGNSSSAGADGSVAIGNVVSASGPASVAFGNGSTSSGEASTAMGDFSAASGDYSTAMGSATAAIGNFSTAMGIGTHAGSYGETSLGRYSLDTAGTAGSWVATDTLFEIGNGADASNLANAVTVLKNGNVGIGADDPGTQLHLASAGALAQWNISGTGANDYSDIILGEGTSGANYAEFIRYSNASAESGRLIIGNYNRTILFTTEYNNGYRNDLTIGSDGKVGMGTADPQSELHVVGDIRFTGVLIDVSDQRLKTDIQPLIEKGSMLERLAQIDGYSFRMKDDKTGKIEYGVLAQEIERVFPELVQTADDEMKTKSVAYIGLIAPMIEATKELQKENEELKAALDAREDRLAALEDRMEALESDMGGVKRHTGFGISKAAIGGAGGLFMLGLLGAVAVTRRRENGKHTQREKI